MLLCLPYKISNRTISLQWPVKYITPADVAALEIAVNLVLEAV